MSTTPPTPSPVLPGSQSPYQSYWNPAQSQRVIEPKTMVFASDMMTNLMKMVEKVSSSSASVLVLGESGTGKELLAHAIHDRSTRRNKPFVAINCGALQEALLESELFGHEKGSFTGAYNRKIGLAEMANGGTLFLDEIGELTPGIQAKLLRFLQEGELYRVGGKEPIMVDVRIISATNRNIEKDVTVGKFREDLYYRINTIVLRTPALRQRREDIPVLVNHFLNHGSQAFLGRGRQVHDEAMKILSDYDWPGNIRELQNICERLQILCDGHTIMPNDLPEHIRAPQQRLLLTEYDPKLTLYELEKRYILKGLLHFHGNKTQAANALGITIKTLYNKLHEYGEFDKFAVYPRENKDADKV